MVGMILRWGVPALVTVVGGTSIAISATSAGMHADLADRAANAIAAPQYSWANVAFDGRDAVVTGTATDQQMIDEAIAEIAALYGVRSVRSEVALAELASPFPFTAILRDGAISLSGGVPDERTHADIILKTGSADDSLRLLGGAPPREVWQAAVDYGLAHLAAFDEGEFTLSDLDIAITGRARSPEAFDALVAMADELPERATVVSRAIEPAVASPFEWHAVFDGRTVAVSGFTPTAAFAESLNSAGIDGFPVSTSMLLASGAPDNFEESAQRLLQNLVRLEEGRADISDSTLKLSGAPPDQSTMDSIRLALSDTDTEIALEPPRVSSYSFTAIRTNGSVALDGFVPDDETRERLQGMEGIDASGLELARGAPARFDSAVEFGLGLLSRMSEGRFTIENTTIALEGRAATTADFESIETALQLGAPQGLILASADVRPPLADPFVWAVEKDASGKVRMSGYVPSAAVHTALRGVAQIDTDTTAIADGAPSGFAAEATAALSLLPLLETAQVEYDGARWVMSGAVGTPQAGFEADKAFAEAGLRAAGWSLVLDLPEAEAPAALPVIEPYVWSAQKTGDGEIAIAGFVPTDGLKKILVGRAGAGVTDNMSLGAGHPGNFIPGALAGFDALLLLDEGELSFDGANWSLTGKVATGSRRLEAEGVLQAAVESADWQVAIQALDAAPVVADYAWSATKEADGRVSLAGYIPSEELRSFVSVRAGSVALDSMEVASGEPVGFLGDVLAGLEALTHFARGTVKYEDGTWTLAGVPGTAEGAELAVASLATSTDAGAGWVKDIAAPVAPVEPEPDIAAVEEVAPSSDTSPEALAGTETAPAEEQVAALAEPAAVPEPQAEASEAAPVARVFRFSAMKPLDGTIDLAGAVPADATRRFFGVIAGAVPTEGMTIATDLPAEFITYADAGIRLLASLDAGEFGLEGDKWVLNGRVESEAQRLAVLQALDALPQAAAWETSITLLPPIDVCRRHVAALATRNVILFQSGSARLADESNVAIDELASYLGECPEATVHVEGHTDSDGDEDANMALSVARAEAVVDALIDRGVGYQRLYAIGYGETLPIADNATAAGKRANRRIAFTILDEHL